jgi:hypothetical protein
MMRWAEEVRTWVAGWVQSIGWVRVEQYLQLYREGPFHESW